MKKAYLLSLIVLLTININPILSQVPQAFRYEFLVRMYNGDIATNKQVGLRVSILDGGSSGQIVYSESHTETTDQFGMLRIEVGNGTDRSGSFTDIDWSKGDYYLKMDEVGGRNYNLMPTFRLLSVPYAMYAAGTQNVDDADADPQNEIQKLAYSNDTLYLSDGGSVPLEYADNQTLSFHDNKLFIKNGNNVALPFNFSDTSAFNEIQQLSRQGDEILLSNDGGSFTDHDTRYSAGNGIAINDTVIENTEPSQWITQGNSIYYNVGSIGIGTDNPISSAALDVASTNQGFLPPRMTTSQRNAIPNPADGLMVFNTETSCINFFNGSNWIEICGSCTPQPTKADAGDDRTDLSGTTVSLAANRPAEGQGEWSVVSGVGGTFANPASPTTTFTGQTGQNYTLAWSISNDCGTSTDEVTISFWSCGYTFTDNRDGQSYKTAKIGDQCWLAQNVNFGKMINGASKQTDNGTIEKYCYDDNAGNCDKYGGLYQWEEMMQYASGTNVQGICPEGWHIPTDSEWKQMEMSLGMTQAQADKTGLRGNNEGTELKPNDTTGFNALLGGSRLSNGIFYAINNYGNFWTASGEVNNAWRRAVSSNTTGIFKTQNEKGEGLSVRCVKD